MVARAPLSIVDRDSVTIDNTVLNPVPITVAGGVTIGPDVFVTNFPNTQNVKVLGSLVPEAYDDLQLQYTDGLVTQVAYFLGVDAVATLQLEYTDGLLTRVRRV